MPNPVGAHVAVGRGRIFDRIDDLGAEAIQIFAGNPRSWAAPRADAGADQRFRAGCEARRLPVFVHAPYLINFGSPSEATLTRSAQALRTALRRAADLGAVGVVLHAGSAVAGRYDDAMRQVREHLLLVLDDWRAVRHDRREVRLLIEPTAGGGGALAWDAASLAEYLEIMGRDERLGVCLDTCHVHAAGHDLGADFARALRAFARAAGPNTVGLIHANDSRDPCGSKRDRHASLGAGTIGADPFAALFRSRPLRGVPIVVETEEGDHKADIATLFRLRDRESPTRT